MGGNDETTGQVVPLNARDRKRKASRPDDLVGEFNREWAVILSRKGTHIMRFTDEEVGDGSTRRVIEYKTASDLRLFYGNRFVTVGQKPTCVADVWLRHPNRKQYKGLIFDPKGGDIVDGKLNLWRGLGVEPRPGDWSRTRQHIKEVLANSDEASDAYVIKWLAWAVQNPSRHCETAVVFRGQKGTGKGLLGKALLRLFGQHGIHISDPRHLVGNFNAHMQDAIFLFVDEAFWGGDVRHDGALKRLITEPTLFIEPKGIDAYMAPNRLKVLMASNEAWAVPATEDERRYAVFDVSSDRKGDPAYFDDIFNELDNGGLEAMLHDLQAMDLKGWHPREIVKTEGLKRQQTEGLKPLERWWLSMLEDGVIPAADPTTPHKAVTEPHEHVSNYGQKTRRPGLLGHLRTSSPRLWDFSAKALGDFLAEKGCERIKRVQGQRGWQFPSLKTAREEWARRFDGWTWPNPEQDDWEPAEVEEQPRPW